MATWLKKQEHGKSVYATIIKNQWQTVQYRIIEISSTEYMLWIQWNDSSSSFKIGHFKSLNAAKKRATEQYGNSPR